MVNLSISSAILLVEGACRNLAHRAKTCAASVCSCLSFNFINIVPCSLPLPFPQRQTLNVLMCGRRQNATALCAADGTSPSSACPPGHPVHRFRFRRWRQNLHFCLCCWPPPSLTVAGCRPHLFSTFSLGTAMRPPSLLAVYPACCL